MSEFSLDVSRISNPSTGTYDSATGQLVLPDALEVEDTVEYDYATGYAQEQMNVVVTISEIKEITVPTTEQPTTEQQTTEQPAVIVPPTTPTDNSKVSTPKTGDTTPLYLVISLFLVSFAGGVTLYIRRRKKI